MEKKFLNIDKGTNLVSSKYNNQVEGAKGLFEFYNSRNNSCKPDSRMGNFAALKTNLSQCDQDSSRAQPAHSRGSDFNSPNYVSYRKNNNEMDSKEKSQKK